MGTKRLLLTVVALGIPTMLLLPAADAQVPTEDSVTGTVTLVQGGPTFRFDAHSGPSGENPRGTITRLDAAGNADVVASVVCLAVDGSRATVAAMTGGFPPEQPVAFVEDNDGVGVDRFLGVTGQASGCPLDPPAGASLTPIFSGDLHVVDAQPVPTSKDQCKKGGWKIYGVFKTQGDCVSFVATGGKKPAGHDVWIVVRGDSGGGRESSGQAGAEVEMPDAVEREVR